MSALVNIILKSDTPFTIGILGDWGVGKTSLMKMMFEELKKQSEIIPIWFNAWRCEREREFAIVPLLGTILTKVEDNDLIQAIKDYLKSIRIKLNLGFVEVGAESQGQRDELKELYYDKLEAIEEKMKKFNKKIVVFIDDLDRCAPDKILEVLESIKVFLDVKGFAYILGVNPEVVERAIEQKYENMGIRGEDYLEKLIQIPFKIPEWNKEDLYTYFEYLIENEVDSKYKKTFKNYKDVILEVIEKTPRQVKRFVNTYICEQEVFKDMEFDRKIHLVLTILKFRWYDFYCNLFNNIFREKLRKILADKTLTYEDKLNELKEELKIDEDLLNFIMKVEKVKSIVDNIVNLDETKLFNYRRAGMAIPREITKESTITREKLIKLLRFGNIKEFNKIREGLETIDLIGVDLRDAYLSGANLSGANLIEADLRGAYLSRADLSSANLSRADLIGVDLFRANLSGANLIEADLRGAYLGWTIILSDESKYKNAIVKNADFKDAIINNKKLREYLRSNGAINVPDAITDEDKIIEILEDRSYPSRVIEEIKRYFGKL